MKNNACLVATGADFVQMFIVLYFDCFLLVFVGYFVCQPADYLCHARLVGVVNVVCARPK